jgi:preprotein translocase subunit YajC
VWNVVFAQAPEGAEPAAQPPSVLVVEPPKPDNPAAQGPQGGLGSFLPMIVIFFAIMYFLMIRPNQKRERERRAMLAALAKGDKVVTTGGICGTVVGLSERSVVVRVDDNVNIEFLRGAVSQITSHEKEE